jgi:hypothetical protein
MTYLAHLGFEVVSEHERRRNDRDTSDHAGRLAREEEAAERAPISGRGRRGRKGAEDAGRFARSQRHLPLIVGR